MRTLSASLIAFLLLSCAGLAPPVRALAAEEEPAAAFPRRSSERQSQRKPAGRSGTSTRASAGWGNVAGALAIVVVLILATARLLKHKSPAGPASLPRDAVEVFGQRSLDHRTGLSLVRCGSRLLLLGNSPSGLSTLAEFTDTAEVDTLTRLCRPSSAGGSGAGLDEALGRLHDAAPEEAPVDEAEIDPPVLRLRARLSQAQPASVPGRFDLSPEEAAG